MDVGSLSGSNMRAETSLPPSLASAREARSFVREAIGTPVNAVEAVETLELLISEVVTNAVQHTGAAPRVEVSRRGGTVRVSVRDPSPRWPTRRDVPESALSGRGMALVDILSSSWGVERLDHAGKSVWFEVQMDRRTLGPDGESAGWSRSGDDLAEEGRGSTGHGAG